MAASCVVLKAAPWPLPGLMECVLFGALYLSKY